MFKVGDYVAHYKEGVCEVTEIGKLDMSCSDKRKDREAMLANQCRQWAALIKTSYLRKRKRMSCGKKAVSVDDRYLSMAEYFLTGELAIALDMSREAVRSCIIDNISE